MFYCCSFGGFFFFNQKTAYEMRISDWSSDVCSSDLEDYQCGACLAEPPPFERARAVMRYDEASRPLLLGFKHGDRTEAAPPFAAWMARSGVEMLATAELVAPVPLHWRRLRSEGHTSELQSLMRISYAVFCLKKKNREQAQTI